MQSPCSLQSISAEWGQRRCQPLPVSVSVLDHSRDSAAGTSRERKKMLAFPVMSPLFRWFPRPHLLPHLPYLPRLQDGLHSIHPRPPPPALEEGADWSRDGVRLAPWTEQPELICTQGCSGRMAEAPALPGGALGTLGCQHGCAGGWVVGFPWTCRVTLGKSHPLGPCFLNCKVKGWCRCSKGLLSVLPVTLLGLPLLRLGAGCVGGLRNHAGTASHHPSVKVLRQPARR